MQNKDIVFVVITKYIKPHQVYKYMFLIAHNL